MAGKPSAKVKAEWEKAIREVGARRNGLSSIEVREARGKGSLTDAAKAIALFEIENSEEFKSFEKPQELIPSCLDDPFRDVWNAALDHAKRRVIGEQVEGLEKEIDTYKEKLKMSKEAEQRLLGRIEQLEKEVRE